MTTRCQVLAIIYKSLLFVYCSSFSGDGDEDLETLVANVTMAKALDTPSHDLSEPREIVSMVLPTSSTGIRFNPLS